MTDATYYFNSKSTTVWSAPEKMVDNFLTNYANTVSDGDTEVLNGNSCPGINLGTISKVEIRAYGYGDGNDRIDLTPVFGGSDDGDEHQTTPANGTPGWGAYQDITNDTNHPSPWTWSAVQDLDCKVEYDKVAAAHTMYCAKVEVRVTYPGAVGWLSGYTYRREGAVNSTTEGAQTNYQKELLVGESSGASGEDVNCEGHCIDFPDDIRFTKEDGATKHNYWVESISGTTPNRLATIKIKVTAIPASGDIDFYMYYGKTSDSGESNGDNTFDFFENDWDKVAQLQIGSSTYDAFGLLVKTGNDTIIYFTRQGTSHVGDKGKIIKLVFTPSTNSWGTRTDVYNDANANYDSRNVGGGIIGSNIYVFFARYNKSTSAWVDNGYIKSTDLTGNSWGSYIPISVSPSIFSPYGGIIPTANSNTYLQPWYGLDGSTYSVKVFKTINSGTSWSVGSTIYSGITKYTETCLAYIGSNKIIALLRDNDGGYVYQATSSDNGDTWSSPTATNLGASTGVKIPWIIYDSATAKVIALYMDRNNDELKTSEVDANTVYSSASSWATQKIIHDYNHLGYPSMVKVSSGHYFLVYCQEMSSSDVDTYGCFYPVKWRRYGLGTTFSVSSGLLDFEGGTGNENAEGDIIKSYETFTYPHKLRCRYKWAGGAGVDNKPNIGFGVFSYAPISTQCALALTYSTATGTYVFTVEDGSVRSYSAPFSRESDYGITDIKWKLGEVKFKRGANEDTRSTNTPAQSIPVCFGGDYAAASNQAFHTYGDWFAVSKYADPEPTWGNWGAEESGTIVRNYGYVFG